MADRPSYRGFVKHLERWGLTVEEKGGWRDRGRPFDFYPKAVFCHHTASGSSSGNFASDGIVTFGRSDLPGPLCQFLLGRNGTIRITAGGYANHAGFGGPHAGIPENRGNTYAYGIEAENNGVGEPWPREQLNAYYRLCAALLDWMNIDDVSVVFGHKEWTSRKIDPAGIDMNRFRANVQLAVDQGPTIVTVHLSNLTPANHHKDIRRVKRRLVKKGLLDASALDPQWDDFYGIGFKTAYAKWQRSLGYEGKDANGEPGKKSLQKLGFRVRP